MHAPAGAAAFSVYYEKAEYSHLFIYYILFKLEKKQGKGSYEGERAEAAAGEGTDKNI